MCEASEKYGRRFHLIPEDEQMRVRGVGGELGGDQITAGHSPRAFSPSQYVRMSVGLHS